MEDDMSPSYLRYEYPNEIHELTARFVLLVSGFLDDEVCASRHASNRMLFKYEHSNSKLLLLSSRTIELALPSSLIEG